MKYLESFKGRNDKSDKKRDISDYSRGGRCRSKCNREVIRTIKGPKIVCHGCKRIISDLQKD